MAGLAWVNDGEPGIRRVRRAAGFAYIAPDGREIRDDAELARIRRLAVPPAYEEVWICTRADGHLQATGRDARGRKQYRYHPEWLAQRGETKFASLLEFGRVLPAVRQRVERGLAIAAATKRRRVAPTREVVLATIVRLLDTTFFRIGNDEYARVNRSYGLTTLRCEHVGVRGAALHLSFTGKGGVRHEARLADPRIAGVVRRCRELPGQELFRYVDDDGATCRVGSADVNEWLGAAARGVRVTAKQFRTWHGSVQALALVVAAARADAAPGVTAIVGEVARRLGNTPAVCRKAYIHPAVLALADRLASAESRAALLHERWLHAPPLRRGLSVAERQLVGLLQQGMRRGRGAAVLTFDVSRRAAPRVRTHAPAAPRARREPVRPAAS